MFEGFENYLKEKKIELTESELQYIESLAVKKKVRKKQFLLEEGEVCVQQCFILKGCFRAYRISDDGSEHIIRFAIENWWITDLESYSNGTPSTINIDALEDCEILLWSKENFDLLLNDIPAFNSFRNGLIARSLNASQNRVYTSISFTAEEKYRNFLENNSDIANRIPLQMIASYLGLTRETLTRIRKNMIGK